MATVTLLYFGESTGSWNTITGSLTNTIAAGDTLIAAFTGINFSDLSAMTDSAGTFTKETNSFVAYSDSSSCYGGFYVQKNCAGGSHVITPPTVTGGTDGLLYIWKYSGGPATPATRTTAKVQQISSSTTLSLSSGTSPSAPVSGDAAFAIRSHENTVGSTTIFSTVPSGFTDDGQYTNGSVNLPTQACHRLLGSGGAFTATWVVNDPAIHDTIGAILVLEGPSSSGISIAWIQA